MKILQTRKTLQKNLSEQLQHSFISLFAIFIIFFFIQKSFAQETTAENSFESCQISENDIKQALEEVSSQPQLFDQLPTCYKSNRSFMIKAVLIDPNFFQHASEILKEDENFLHRLLKVNPDVLQFASNKLRANPNFMELATYINRPALKYADPKLLNDKVFMRQMIKIDPKNYIFASDRLKENEEFIEIAFNDDGALLAFAPAKIKANKKFVTLAIASDASALKYASENLQQDKNLKKIAENRSSIKSLDDFKKFLINNYTAENQENTLKFSIKNRAKFFTQNQIIDRNYVTKWQKFLEYKSGTIGEDMRLISADNRNYPNSWKEDFKAYPDLIKKIENFFSDRNVDQNTIDSLSTTFFWKIKNNPNTVAFNLYLLRNSQDKDLGPNFSDITSLSAIAQKRNGIWHFSVVEVIFGNETKTDIAYENGHKRYVLWDLYITDNRDKNPKIIFKVEDKFKDYFEVFEEKNNGKYRSTYVINFN